MRFRCPNCLHQIAIELEKTDASQLTCPSCQSRISLAPDEETVTYSYSDLPQIARYELRELLGEGSFGTVFRAFDPDLERDIALNAVSLMQKNLGKLPRHSGTKAARQSATSHQFPNRCLKFGVSFQLQSNRTAEKRFSSVLIIHLLDRRKFNTRQK